MKRVGATLVLALANAAQAAVDLAGMWDFDRPEQSEQRFRAALERVGGDDALVLRTQIARTFSLRGRYEEAHRELDAIEPLLDGAGPEPRVRAWLERGRTLRSAGRVMESEPWFVRAYELAEASRLEGLAADALHMVALAQTGLDSRIEWNRRTIAYAQSASDPKVRGWEAVALNNIGSDLRQAGRLTESLAAFREALAAYEKSGRAGGIRIARWQVANVLRLLGRADEALLMQLALEREWGAAGRGDPYVFEELALLYAARGDEARSAHYRALHAKEKSP